MSSLDRVFKLFTSDRNKQFIVECILKNTQRAGVTVPPQSLVTEIQLHIDKVWIDNIQNLARRFNNDPKGIIHDLNNTLINYYTRCITNGVSPSVDYHQSDDFFNQKDTTVTTSSPKTSEASAPLDLTIVNNSLTTLANKTSTVQKKSVFNYLVTSTTPNQKLVGVNLGHVEEIRCTKFEYFNNVYSVKSFKFSIKLSVSSTPSKYTFPGGNYQDYRSVLRALSDLTLESNVIWIYDELLGRTRVEWHGKQDKGPTGSPFAPKVEHFLLTFADVIDAKFFGFSQPVYSGGKMYLSEMCHRFRVPPRIDVRLNNALHKASGDTPFVSFRVECKKFGEWITELNSSTSGTGYIKLSSPINLDDLIVNVRGLDNSEWSLELQINTVEI